ncbi:MAG: hypothetical protein ACUZ8O_15300 [Candidatus Anammoxibacter sp.]
MQISKIVTYLFLGLSALIFLPGTEGHKELLIPTSIVMAASLISLAIYDKNKSKG